MMRVFAAAVLSARGLLLVSKRAAPRTFYLPGGKPEPGEPPLSCLQRELREELGVEIAEASPLLEVHAMAALERVAMHMSVFLTCLRGDPRAGGEIHSLRWWPEDPELSLAPAVRDVVIPRLADLGHLTRAASAP
jgi:8-oxo-dGTP diphosphatase